MKPPIPVGMIAASAAPASIKSASPRAMWPAALRKKTARGGGCDRVNKCRESGCLIRLNYDYDASCAPPPLPPHVVMQKFPLAQAVEME